MWFAILYKYDVCNEIQHYNRCYSAHGYSISICTCSEAIAASEKPKKESVSIDYIP